MSGIVRLAASIVILLVAGLATALVFDVIPPDVFGDALKKLAEAHRKRFYTPGK